MEERYSSSELLRLDAFLLRCSEIYPDMSADLLADLVWEKLGMYIDGDDVVSRLIIYFTDGDNHFSLN
jgi:hypothetical protein